MGQVRQFTMSAETEERRSEAAIFLPRYDPEIQIRYPSGRVA
jgi:hypothetical protein